MMMMMVIRLAWDYHIARPCRCQDTFDSSDSSDVSSCMCRERKATRPSDST